MLLYAHRGASGYAPENTMEAFELAIQIGCDGMETDIHLTKDNILVLMHDEKIDRTTNGKGYIKDYTYHELLKFDANNRFKEYKNCKIPTLEQLLLLAKKTHTFLNLEIKTDHIFYPDIEQKIVDLVKTYDMEELVWYSSFNHYSVMKIKEITPKAPVSLLYEGELFQPWQYALSLGVQGLHPNVPNLHLDNYVAMCHLHNLVVNVWTVNEKADMLLANKCGVDGIFTNYLDKAKQVIK